MNKIKKIIRYDKKIMTLLNIIAIIGIITGSMFIVILNKSDKSLVVSSIKDFFNCLSVNQFDYLSTLKNIFISNYIFSFLIWIIGISVIGVVVTIIIIYYKAFSLGFTITSIIYTYSFKGIALAIFYAIPHLIIDILVLMYLGSYSIDLSIVLINSIFKKKSLNFKQFLNNYLRVLVISLIILTVSILYETFISTYILKCITKLLF